MLAGSPKHDAWKDWQYLTPKVLRIEAQGWCEERTPTLGCTVKRPEPRRGSDSRVGVGYPNSVPRPNPRQNSVGVHDLDDVFLG